MNKTIIENLLSTQAKINHSELVSFLHINRNPKINYPEETLKNFNQIKNGLLKFWKGLRNIDNLEFEYQVEWENKILTTSGKIKVFNINDKTCWYKRPAHKKFINLPYIKYYFKIYENKKEIKINDDKFNNHVMLNLFQSKIEPLLKELHNKGFVEITIDNIPTKQLTITDWNPLKYLYFKYDGYFNQKLDVNLIKMLCT